MSGRFPAGGENPQADTGGHGAQEYCTGPNRNTFETQRKGGSGGIKRSFKERENTGFKGLCNRSYSVTSVPLCFKDLGFTSRPEATRWRGGSSCGNLRRPRKSGSCGGWHQNDICAQFLLPAC